MRFRSSLRFTLPVLGLLALLPHCKTAPSTESSATASASASAPPSATAPALPPFQVPTAAPVAVPTQLKVTSTGATPRRELRYKYKGAKETDMTMELGMSVQMGMAGQSGVPVVLPSTRVTMHVTPKAVSDGGDLSYEFDIVKLDVATDSKAAPPIVTAMKTSMDKLKGTHGSGVVSNLGESKNISVSVSPDVPPQVRELMDRMRQQLGELSVQLPTEAVGKGAEWEKTSGFMANGLLVEQTAKYTLTSLEGEVMKLSVSVTQKAQPQEIKAPGLPPGSKVYLETLDASGSGDATRDMTKLVGSSTIAVKSKTTSRVSQAGKEAPMTMNIEVSTTIAPASASK